VVRFWKAVRICRDILAYYCGRRRNTICPFLWTMSTIYGPQGNVYACCMKAPWSVGNIHKQTLGKIWHTSIRLGFARWLSMHGALHCFEQCFMAKQPVHLPTIVPEYPFEVMIEMGTQCNLQCLMCSQDHTSTSMIDYAVLKNNVDWKRINRIIFTGGEVLHMPGFREFYLWVTRDHGHQANVLSNGVLIDDAWARVLLAWSQWIYISINAATEKTYTRVCRSRDFSKVIGNIKNLVALKRELKSSSLIEMHFTIVPLNVQEIIPAIYLADSLGCDKISFSMDAGGSQILENSGLKEEIRAAITDMIRYKRVAVTFNSEWLNAMGICDTEKEGAG